VIATMTPHPAWRELIRISVRRVYAYRARMLFWLLTTMIQLYLLRAVWTAVYAGRETLEGIPAESLLVYLTISALQGYVIPNSIVFEIETRITTGQVAADLIRPFNFMKQMVAIQIGSLVGIMPLLVVAVPVAMLVGSLRLPSAENLAAYAISFALASVVSVLMWLIIGLSGFWLLDTSGLRSLIYLVSGFLAGSLVPLWFMPDALRTVIAWLPFQAMTFLPASIFAGQVTGTAIFRPLAVQGLWIMLLLGLARLVWNRAQRKLVIQGG